jgi:hypothetical protein
LANVTPDPLDAFGQFVMENLRDTAIGYYDGLAEGHWKAPALQPLQADLQSMSVRERGYRPPLSHLRYRQCDS